MLWWDRHAAIVTARTSGAKAPDWGRVVAAEAVPLSKTVQASLEYPSHGMKLHEWGTRCVGPPAVFI